MLRQVSRFVQARHGGILKMQGSLTRREFVQLTAACAGVSACTPTSSEVEELPNIILCMGDDHGWHETGYYDHPDLQTPVLDEMAATGLRMDRFYSAAPVCSPTRGSVITGRHPNRYGTFTPNFSIRPEEISIAQVLSQHGYACGHFGKWHLGPVKADSPTNPGAMGFEDWLSHDNFFEMNPYLSRNGGPPERHEGESSRIVIEEATRFIQKAKQQGRPFFAVVWFGSPHEPYSGLDEDLALYENLPEELKSQETRLTSMKTGLPTQLPLDQVLRTRFAEITAMDRAMGQLRTFLQEEELRENTLLWYCSDNGAPGDGSYASPFRGQKGRVYEGGVRVPSVIEWPQRIPEPRNTEVNAVTSDIFPTLCDLVDEPLPDRPLDGISLLPLIEGSMQERPKPICFWNHSVDNVREQQLEPYLAPNLQEGTTPLAKLMNGIATRNFRNYRYSEILDEDYLGPRAIVDNRFKLVVAGEGETDASSPVMELFDLDKDQAESTDLQESNMQVVEDLATQLEQWQQSVLDSLTGKDYS